MEYTRTRLVLTRDQAKAYQFDVLNTFHPELERTPEAAYALLSPQSVARLKRKQYFDDYVERCTHCNILQERNERYLLTQKGIEYRSKYKYKRPRRKKRLFIFLRWFTRSRES